MLKTVKCDMSENTGLYGYISNFQHVNIKRQRMHNQKDFAPMKPVCVYMRTVGTGTGNSITNTYPILFGALLLTNKPFFFSETLIYLFANYKKS